MDFRERYGTKEDGTLGLGELVKEKKKEKRGMGKEMKVIYGTIMGRRRGVSEVGAEIGQRQLDQ